MSVGEAETADVVLVGAGPVGLFAVFQLGLVGMKACVLDSRPEPGGQCTALYPDKPIFDIPALPRITGRQLIERLVEQGRPFDPVFHMGETVMKLHRSPDSGHFVVETDRGRRIAARIVVIAAGGGCLEPKRPPIPGVQDLEDGVVFYKVDNIAEFAGHDVLIVGGGDSALDWLLELYPVAASVSLLHRRDVFRANPESVHRLRRLVAHGSVSLHIGQATDIRREKGRVIVEIRGSDEIFHVNCSKLLFFFGLSSQIGPIDQWDLDMVGKRIVVETTGFGTSMPGVYAIGDINVYTGKRKLILSGFHEAAMMAWSAYGYVYPQGTPPQEHTTSSRFLQEKVREAP